jgi:hypothetical protein
MNFIGRTLALTAMVLLGANSSMAQMHAGGPDDLSESPAIYSPYVERTAVDAIPTCTHRIPLMPE